MFFGVIWQNCGGFQIQIFGNTDQNSKFEIRSHQKLKIQTFPMTLDCGKMEQVHFPFPYEIAQGIKVPPLR